jgi:hypothetical protein
MPTLDARITVEREFKELALWEKQQIDDAPYILQKKT